MRLKTSERFVDKLQDQLEALKSKILTIMPGAEAELGKLLGPVSEPAVSSISAESRGILDAFDTDGSDKEEDKLKEKSKVSSQPGQSNAKAQKTPKTLKKAPAAATTAKKNAFMDQDSATMEIEPTPRLSDQQDNLETETYFQKSKNKDHSRSPNGSNQEQLR